MNDNAFSVLIMASMLLPIIRILYIGLGGVGPRPKKPIKTPSPLAIDMTIRGLPQYQPGAHWCQGCDGIKDRAEFAFDHLARWRCSECRPDDTGRTGKAQSGSNNTSTRPRGPARATRTNLRSQGRSRLTTRPFSW